MKALTGLPVKRYRRSVSALEQLDQQIIGVLTADHPQSVRHVFYRMTDPRLPESVEKSDKGYNCVQRRLIELRRSGRVPYGWITDTTRRGYHVNTYASAADAVRSWQCQYRADLWATSDQYVEVWCESRSIAGVIEETCRELGVSLYPSGGFTSLTLAYQAAEYINQVATDANVIYIGDYDPAGVLIDRKIEEELRHHLAHDVDLSFHRIAITEEQIVEMDLPTKPRKDGDRRSAHVLSTVEAEAMPASVMRSLLRDTIEAYLPTGALAAAKAAEESERSTLNFVADLLEKAR